MSDRKFAVLVNADTDEPNQLANGLQYAVDLDDSGFHVEVYFDGAATDWIPVFRENSDHTIKPYYDEVYELTSSLASAATAPPPTTSTRPPTRRGSNSPVARRTTAPTSARSPPPGTSSSPSASGQRPTGLRFAPGSTFQHRRARKPRDRSAGMPCRN